MDKDTRTNPQALQIPDVLQWQMPWVVDPAPMWLLDRVEFPKETLTELALLQMQFTNDVREIQSKACKQGMDILRKSVKSC